MINEIYRLLQPAFFKIEPEKAHNLALWALQKNIISGQGIFQHPMLKQEIAGLDFLNPVGLAAGFDKNALVYNKIFKLGFGSVESGTLTPLPQNGNPRPRMFRLVKEQGLINRLGFNNKGIAAAIDNISKNKINEDGIFGLNIGKNKDTINAVDDYILALENIYGLSDYITINISSPNTPNLRQLQNEDELQNLLAAIRSTMLELQEKYDDLKIPLFLKLAPDIADEAVGNIVEIAIDNGVDALIISNTTISRDNVQDSPYAKEMGGLSGLPLRDLSDRMLATFAISCKGRIPIIGVGGVNDGLSAYNKIKLGASLVQLYTGMIYQGFDISQKICKELVMLLRNDGYSHISEAVGASLL